MRPTSPSNRCRSRDVCERKDCHHAWKTHVRTSDRIGSLHAAAWSHRALSSHVVSYLADHVRPSGTVRNIPGRSMDGGRSGADSSHDFKRTRSTKRPTQGDVAEPLQRRSDGTHVRWTIRCDGWWRPSMGRCLVSTISSRRQVWRRTHGWQVE